ncbi:glycine cleavage system aminomethyltransferase GcvT [Eubacteriales bacterium OttesenSCG-928-M02]|nr:glycine cleavage system aminomethyltransferase GcvT [Eubacteriales bacterium OttesenSCG-928-M02]
MERKTPLYDTHQKSGGKMVPFAGYLLPIQYPTGILKEHMAVREQAGLFDVSHMGELWLSGQDALGNIQHLVTNDCSKLAIGRICYSPMCYENGTVVDDLLIYKMGEENYLLVVNASNREKDAAFIEEHLFGNVKMEDRSDDTGQIALQGPKAQAILEKLVAGECIPEKYYSFMDGIQVNGVSCLISRTGYTGEDGFELYMDAAHAPKVWADLLSAGEAEGLIPCGLGARDTLRLEGGMPLYGHEMDDTITPLECGLKPFVKMDKADFIGKDALSAPVSRRRIGLIGLSRNIAREGYPVLYDGEAIGHITSGSQSPVLGKPIAMALVSVDKVTLGDVVTIQLPREREMEAEVCPLPFYKRNK